LLAEWLFFSFSFSTFISGFALFAERRYTWHGHALGVKEVGYLFALSGLIGIIMQGGLVGRMVGWLGERRLVQIGFFTSALGYAAVGFTHTVWQLIWVSSLTSIGGAALRPALTSLITRKAGRNEQGLIIGLTQSLMSIAQITSPVISGILIQRHFLTSWAVWAGLLCALALLFQPRSYRTAPGTV
jgi:MFS family permease